MTMKCGGGVISTSALDRGFRKAQASQCSTLSSNEREMSMSKFQMKN